MANWIKACISQQDLPAGFRLPLVRTLSRFYSVTPDTTKQAFNWSKAEGLVHSCRRSGFFVARPNSLPDLATPLVLVLVHQMSTTHLDLVTAIDKGLGSKALMVVRIISDERLSQLASSDAIGYNRLVLITQNPSFLPVFALQERNLFLQNLALICSDSSTSFLNTHPSWPAVEYEHVGLFVCSDDPETVAETVSSWI